MLAHQQGISQELLVLRERQLHTEVSARIIKFKNNSPKEIKEKGKNPQSLTLFSVNRIRKASTTCF